MQPRTSLSSLLPFLLFLVLACSLPLPVAGEQAVESTRAFPSTGPGSPAVQNPSPGTPPAGVDKWSLWTGGTQLRGANIWSRVVVPGLDGPEFLGEGHVGPPYTQADFDRLAALGANYVNLSHPGLFTETPPYVLDEAVQAHLDSLLEMAAHARLFVVITFRTGPGRSDFTFYRDGAGEWFDPDLLREWVWEDADAQDAWVDMWRYTAERYQDHPVVVGYDLMCEPNSAGVFFDLYEPEEFLAQYGGSTYDWNQLYPRLVEAIRAVDAYTPILVAAQGWSAVSWLNALEPLAAERIVYAVHQYEPQEQYTHQEPELDHAYPGRYDIDYDGEPEAFDRAWLADFLSMIARFKERTGAPVVVNEFGVARYAPGAADFMQDELGIFEELGVNYALWAWSPAWEPYSSSVNEFNFLLGPDPADATSTPSALQDVIVSYWARNTARP